MTIKRIGGLLAVGAAVVTATVGLGSATATAAQGEQQLSCDGTTITVRTNDNHSSDKGGWSAAVVVDGGSGILVPTSFAFSAYDETTQSPLFSYVQEKGGGNANHNQDAVSCTQTMQGTLADLLEPGDTPPPGVALTDVVTATFTVTAVPHP